MKKTYITPMLLTVELGTRSHLMDVSSVDNHENINSVSFSTTTTGSGQLTKEHKSVWDNEW